MREPIFQKTKPFEITEFESNAPFNMMRQHYHETYEIYLQLDGDRYLFFDNEKYLLKKGSLFVIAPFVLHMTVNTDNSYFKRYLLNYSPNALSTVMSEQEINDLIKDIPSCVIDLNDEEYIYIHKLFKQIHFYSKNSVPNAYKMMQIASVSLIDVIRELAKKRSTITLIENNIDKSPIYTAISYINSNYDKEISLDFISSYVHMSKSHFCLCFKKLVGDSFINHLNAVRVSQVHRLLTTTDMSLQDIALHTGFTSETYMARIFKKVHGVSPSYLRQRKTK